MISRRVLFTDRVATLVLALLLIAGGAGALWWWSGREVEGVVLAPALDTSAASDLVATAWFAWAAAAAGIVLALIGLRWIAAHLRNPRVRRLDLAGSDDSGHLDVAGAKVARAAADALADTAGVRSATGSVVRDRGQLVARLQATLEPEADLAEVVGRADSVSAELAGVLGRDDLRCRVDLHVAGRRRGRGRTRPRVA